MLLRICSRSGGRNLPRRTRNTAHSQSRPSLNVQFGAAEIIDQKALLSIAICDTCAKLQEFVNYHVGVTAGRLTVNALLSSDLGKQRK